MIAAIVATVASAVVAGVVYLGRERLGPEGLALAALRTVAFGALFLVLFNPGWLRRAAPGAPTVLLDASLSMAAGGGHWQEALDTARTLARGQGGPAGTIFRFGSGLAVFDSTTPSYGTSRLRDALEASVARGGAVYVVSDGEIPDVATLPPSLAHRVNAVVLPRDTVPNAALLDVVMSRRVPRADSIAVTLVIGTWGDVDTAAAIEVFVGERRLLRRRLALPPAPGTARRSVTLPPGVLATGSHVLRFHLDVANDGESGDNERHRPITVTTQPAIVVIVDPADTEGRFLVNEMAEVARTSVRGFARVSSGLWIDMGSFSPVGEAAVRAAARAAALLVIRGRDALGLADGAAAVWYWPAASDPTTEFFEGDWYVTPTPPASPVAGRLAAAALDSVPPLTGIVRLVPGDGEWIGLTGRLARRGADRPLLVGRDSAGSRTLTTAGFGLWRWVLRGTAARETYRTFIAVGTDWLLQSEAVRHDAVLTADDVTQRGVPVAFRWHDDEVPDSAVVTLAGADSTFATVLHFDARGVALVLLDPGTYRWTARGVRGAGGVTVVEGYSDEFHLRRVTLVASLSESAFQLIVRRAREMWWLYLLAMAALLLEWGWRQRRGLP